MATVLGENGDRRYVVRAMLDGAWLPRTADRAFVVGEALRALGVPWCSGVVALYAAGFLADFCRLVVGVALDQQLAARIAFATPFAVSPHADADARNAARGAVTLSGEHALKLAEAWRLWQTKPNRYHDQRIRLASLFLVFTIDAAQRNDLPLVERERVVRAQARLWAERQYVDLGAAGVDDLANRPWPAVSPDAADTTTVEHIRRIRQNLARSAAVADAADTTRA